jgi:hypothetical protein
MNEFISITDLGKLFGLKRRTMGKLLVTVGLRTTDGNATQDAIDGGFTKRIPTNRVSGIEFNIWHAARTVRRLEEAGYRRAINAPPIDERCLVGPFCYRPSGRFIFEVRNANGTIIMVATEEDTARWAAQLLNVAYKHDKL